jgi:hypothetical protein
MAPDDYKHILVVVDKFPKWTEVQVVATITSKEVEKFMEDITHRFGVHHRIVTDLGTLSVVDFHQPRTLVMLWFELHFGTNPPLGMLMI